MPRFLCLLLSLTCLSVPAQAALVIDDQSLAVQVQDYMLYGVVESSEAEIQPGQMIWRPANVGYNLTVGGKRRVIFRIDLDSRISQPQTWVLAIETAYIPTVRAHILRDGHLQQSLWLSSGSNPLGTRYFMLPLPLEPDHQYRVLLDAPATYGRAMIEFMHLAPQQYYLTTRYAYDQVLSAFVLGVHAILLILALTAVWRSNRVIYLAFMLFQLGLIGALLTLKGLPVPGFESVALDFTDSQRLVIIPIMLSFLGASLFSMEYLDLRQRAPWLNIVAKSMCGLYFAVIVVVLLGISEITEYFSHAGVLFSIPYFVVLWLGSLWLWLHRQPGAAGYSVAWGIYLAATVAALLEVVLPYQPTAWYNIALIGQTTSAAWFLLSTLIASLKLEQDQRVAERELRAKTDFLARMSHELRTPLNGVIGMADLLANTAQNHEQRFYTDSIKASGSILLSLVDDILDFGRLQSGKLELEHTPFSLDHLAAECAALLLPMMQTKQVPVYIRLTPATPWRLIGDAHRLRQVLINLVSNALKFTERGQVDVVFDSRVLPRQGTLQLIFSVRDTGIGIESERLDHIFDVFTQADASTTRRFGGSGLGLSISRRLVELMGGTIDAQSKTGQGSCFTVTLPVDVDIGGERERQQQLHQLRNKRVLMLVEDAKVFALYTPLFEAWGTHLSHAADSESAIAKLGQEHYDLLLVQSLDETTLLPLLAHAQRPPTVVQTIGRSPSLPEQPDPHLQVLGSPCAMSDLLMAIEQVLTGSTDIISAPPTATPASKGSSTTPLILVVEDNDVNRQVVKGMLRRLGISASYAVNGAEALEACRQHAFDLVLMDCEMPVMDGLSATRRIRSECRHQPRIVALTAHALPSQQQQCHAAGMDDVLTKPVTVAELEQLISSLQSSRPSNPE